MMIRDSERRSNNGSKLYFSTSLPILSIFLVKKIKSPKNNKFYIKNYSFFFSEKKDIRKLDNKKKLKYILKCNPHILELGDYITTQKKRIKVKQYNNITSFLILNDLLFFE